MCRRWRRDTLAVTSTLQPAPMITIECTWCDAELALETLVETSVDCPDCRITVDIAPDPDTIVVAVAA
jgi:hypothetical protein